MLDNRRSNLYHKIIHVPSHSSPFLKPLLGGGGRKPVHSYRAPSPNVPPLLSPFPPTHTPFPATVKYHSKVIVKMMTTMVAHSTLAATTTVITAKVDLRWFYSFLEQTLPPLQCLASQSGFHPRGSPWSHPLREKRGEGGRGGGWRNLGS